MTLSLPATVASCLAATTREKPCWLLGKQKNGERPVIRFQDRGGAGVLRHASVGLDLPEWGLTLAPKPTALTVSLAS